MCVEQYRALLWAGLQSLYYLVCDVLCGISGVETYCRHSFLFYVQGGKFSVIYLYLINNPVPLGSRGPQASQGLMVDGFKPLVSVPDVVVSF